MANLFSVKNLHSFLKYCEYLAIGTIRENRIQKTAFYQIKKKNADTLKQLWIKMIVFVMFDGWITL